MQRAEWARGREAEGGSVCPEPTLNRRSMGHTLEENGKWGSWRGWPGKDGIPPFALTFLFLSFSLTGVLSFLPDSLIPVTPRVLDALLLPHPPSSTCRPCCSSSSTVPLLPPISYFVLSPSSRHGRAVSPYRVERRCPAARVLPSPCSRSRALRRRHANEGHPATEQAGVRATMDDAVER